MHSKMSFLPSFAGKPEDSEGEKKHAIQVLVCHLCQSNALQEFWASYFLIVFAGGVTLMVAALCSIVVRTPQQGVL